MSESLHFRLIALHWTITSVGWCCRQPRYTRNKTCIGSDSVLTRHDKIKQRVVKTLIFSPTSSRTYSAYMLKSLHICLCILWKKISWRQCGRVRLFSSKSQVLTLSTWETTYSEVSDKSTQHMIQWHMTHDSKGNNHQSVWQHPKDNISCNEYGLYVERLYCTVCVAHVYITSSVMTRSSYLCLHNSTIIDENWSFALIWRQKRFFTQAKRKYVNLIA